MLRPCLRAGFCIWVLFASHYCLGRYQSSEACDLDLNVAEFLFDQALTRKERIVGHLKDREGRRNKTLHPSECFKIDPCGIQPPKLPKVNVEGERHEIEFMKVAVFAYFPALDMLEHPIFVVVQMDLGELHDRVFALGPWKTLLQHPRPSFRVGIRDGPEPIT